MLQRDSNTDVFLSTWLNFEEQPFYKTPSVAASTGSLISQTPIECIVTGVYFIKLQPYNLEYYENRGSSKVFCCEFCEISITILCRITLNGCSWMLKGLAENQ